MTELTPDLSQTRRFLDLLDPDATTFTFQVFNDCKTLPGPPPKILCGTLDEHAEELTRLNQAGAGIFVTVNHTINGGRKKADVDLYRAVWREADTPDLPALPFEPHVIVETSPNKKHEYILILPTKHGDFWDGVMGGMVEHFGSDPNARDRSRVLRLPGFYHQKNRQNPHMVRIIHESGMARIPIMTVSRKIQPVTKPEPPPRQEAEPKTTTKASVYGQRALDAELEKVRQSTEGSRNATLNIAALSLGGLVAGGELPEEQVISELTMAAQQVGLTSEEIRATIRSGLEAGKRQPRQAPPKEHDTRQEPPWPEDRDYQGPTGDTGPEQGNKQQAGESWLRTAYENGGVARFMDTEPPPFDWIFDGTLMAGTVGLMVGPGAVGKSYMALILLISAASGRTILPAFRPTGPGRVFGMFCEDQEAILHHRFHDIAASLGLTDEERRLVRQNMRAITASGVDVRLIDTTKGLEATPFFQQAQDVLGNGSGLRLIVLDPFSRLNGADENDNSAATFFIEKLEQIANGAGGAVLGLHHVGKRAGMVSGQFDLDAAMSPDVARGASGLTWAARWQLNVFGLPERNAKKELGVNQALSGEYLATRVSKKNYGPGEPVHFLHRLPDGVLSPVEPVIDSNPPDLDEILRKLVLSVVSEAETTGRPLTRKMVTEGYISRWKADHQGVTGKAIDRSITGMMIDGQLFERSSKNSKGRPTTYLSTIEEV